MSLYFFLKVGVGHPQAIPTSLMDGLTDGTDLKITDTVMDMDTITDFMDTGMVIILDMVVVGIIILVTVMDGTKVMEATMEDSVDLAASSVKTEIRPSDHPNLPIFMTLSDILEVFVSHLRL